IPVPAGISFPMITFSLRPSRLSLLPWIAASVRTFVVSWKDAADSHDSLADEVQLHLARAHDPQHLVRVHRTLGELLADLDVRAVLDPQPRPARQLVVDDLVGAVVRSDGQLAELLAVLDPDRAGQFGDRRLALGHAGLEELDHTRQTVGDVLTRDTTGVEGAHRQLGAGLTDRLGSDDADRLADVHQLAGRERAAVAGGTRAHQRLTGEDDADLDLRDARLDQGRD